jgi:hypothetical protein
MKELENVFKDDYKFEIKNLQIKKGKDPQKQVDHGILGLFIDHEDEHTLLIIYYAGHAYHSGLSALSPSTNTGHIDPETFILVG